jgi:membrane-associated protease RseP (regulator of RpoE activity)
MVLLFIGFVMLTIIIHELGHMVVALLCGVKVEAFGIGFGKILLHKKFKEIDFRLCLFPVGGYCKLCGEDIGHLKHDFASQPYLKKFLILIAGVSMNLLLASVCYLFLYHGNIFQGFINDWQYAVCLFSKDYSLMPPYPNNQLVNLGLMNFFCFVGNLFPIIPLDGGHLWFQLIKNKLSKTVQKVFNIIGLTLVTVLQLAIIIYWMV